MPDRVDPAVASLGRFAGATVAGLCVVYVAVLAIGLAGRARALLVASAVLAFVGLLGVPLANMQLRNIGIAGYAVLFPMAAAILALMFHRAR